MPPGSSASAIAVVLAAWRMKQQLDGREIGFLLPVTPGDSDTLLVTILILGVLGDRGRRAGGDGGRHALRYWSRAFHH